MISFRKAVAATAVVVASVLPAAAETVDVAAVKCSELATMSKDDGTILIMWLHGYYGGKAGDTTIDFEALGTVAGAIGEGCAAAPDAMVMEVLAELVGE